MALELGTDVVDVGRGLLGVEDTGADLDRLGDGLRAGLACSGALLHDAGGALVADGQPLDDQAVVERAHRALGAVTGAVVEW